MLTAQKINTFQDCTNWQSVVRSLNNSSAALLGLSFEYIFFLSSL